MTSSAGYLLTQGSGSTRARLRGVLDKQPAPREQDEAVDELVSNSEKRSPSLDFILEKEALTKTDQTTVPARETTSHPRLWKYERTSSRGP